MQRVVPGTERHSMVRIARSRWSPDSRYSEGFLVQGETPWWALRGVIGGQIPDAVRGSWGREKQHGENFEEAQEARFLMQTQDPGTQRKRAC